MDTDFFLCTTQILIDFFRKQSLHNYFNILAKASLFLFFLNKIFQPTHESINLFKYYFFDLKFFESYCFSVKFCPAN
jgi:hypothetical protein